MCGWFVKSVAAVVVIGLWVGQARAETSLNDVLNQYDSPNVSEAQRSVIASNLSGIEVGLGWANTALRAQRMQPSLYCAPERAITPVQLIEILRRAVKAEPRLGDRPVGFAMLAALQRAYPCKQ